MDYTEVCHKGYWSVFCNMQNVHKQNCQGHERVAVVKRRNSKILESISAAHIERQDLKIFCKRSVLKMTQL